MPMVCKAWRDVWYEIDAQIDAQRVKEEAELAQLQREKARLQLEIARLRQQRQEKIDTTQNTA